MPGPLMIHLAARQLEVVAVLLRVLQCAGIRTAQFVVRARGASARRSGRPATRGPKCLRPRPACGAACRARNWHLRRDIRRHRTGTAVCRRCGGRAACRAWRNPCRSRCTGLSCEFRLPASAPAPALGLRISSYSFCPPRAMHVPCEQFVDSATQRLGSGEASAGSDIFCRSSWSSTSPSSLAAGKNLADLVEREFEAAQGHDHAGNFQVLLVVRPIVRLAVDGRRHQAGPARDRTAASAPGYRWPMKIRRC